MERIENELLLEAVEGRLEFGFWASVWSVIKRLWQHVWFADGHVGVSF